jgi:hypothetical protein
MKTFVHYDAEGTIRALIGVDAPEGVHAGVEPAPGELVQEVEELDVDLANIGELDLEAIDRIGERYRIEPHQPRPAKLVKR